MHLNDITSPHTHLRNAIMGNCEQFAFLPTLSLKARSLSSVGCIAAMLLFGLVVIVVFSDRSRYAKRGGASPREIAEISDV